MDDVTQRRQGQTLIDHSRRLEDLESREKVIGDPVSPFLGLIGLRCLWQPGASIDNTGLVYDQSGQARHLTMNGGPVLRMPTTLAPAMLFNGTTDFYSRSDEAGLRVVGNESYVASSARGLTAGGWFQPLALGGTQAFISKYNATGNQRHWLIQASGTQLQTFLSSTGAVNTQQNSSVTLANNTWYFIALRFTTSSGNQSVFVNGTIDTSASGLATLFNSTAALQIAANNAGTNFFSGNVAMAFYCAASLTDTQLGYLFARTRPFFQAAPL